MKSGSAGLLACIVLLSGCASAPSTPPEPGKLQVEYSTELLDGSKLKKQPEEVTIVQRTTTGKAVAAQVGLNLLMLLGGGGAGFSGFSKDDLEGERIEDASDRANLQNPVPGAFTQSLQTAVDAKMVQENIRQNVTFRKPLVVGGGNARLVYDALLGSDEASYQLVLELDVYKRPERIGWGKPRRSVSCSERSDPPHPLAYWAESSYSPVHVELDRMLADCQKKVLADLPRLLAP